MNTQGISPMQQSLESIDKLNDMFKNISATQMHLQDKMMKVTVTAKVTSVGQNVDTTA